MGRRGSLVATVAAGVLAGLAGPATAASAATGFEDGRAAHTVTYAVDFGAEGTAEGPGALVGGLSTTASPSATSSTSSTSSTPGTDEEGPGTIADTGAGVLPWITAVAAGALGVGAVVFAMIRRRSE
ncbi:hypothetical protein [Streptomyces sp. NPDC047525]|uniref:hypothetical protein n=1 Tax=Streptomyces sp. NPDC047525 TaxID=3155264 RepID=UPI003406B0FA